MKHVHNDVVGPEFLGLSMARLVVTPTLVANEK